MDFGIGARVVLRANGTVDLKIDKEEFSLLGNDVAEIVEILEDIRREVQARHREREEKKHAAKS